MQAIWVSLAAGIATLFVMVSIRYMVQAWSWAGRCARWERARRGMCPTCGYDLRGNTSGRCPECGEVLDRDERAPAGLSIISETQPWWVWAAVVGVMVAAAMIERLADRAG